MRHRPCMLTGCLIACLVLPASAGAEDRHPCQVDAIAGPEARRLSEEFWFALSEGERIPADATVATGPATRLRIVCGRDTVVTVGVGTRMDLAELTQAEQGLLLELIDGIVGVFLPDDSAAELEVRTPLAIASVRATRWLVEHSAGDGTAVFTQAGAVAVRMGDDGPPVTVEAGEGVSISAAGEAGAVKTWGVARIRRSTDALGFDWE